MYCGGSKLTCMSAGNFVKALVKLPPKTNLMGASDLATWKEWCEVWGKVNGVQCNYEEMDPAELEPMFEAAGLGRFGKEMGDAFRVSGVIYIACAPRSNQSAVYFGIWKQRW